MCVHICLSKFSPFQKVTANPLCKCGWPTVLDAAAETEEENEEITEDALDEDTEEEEDEAVGFCLDQRTAVNM